MSIQEFAQDFQSNWKTRQFSGWSWQDPDGVPDPQNWGIMYTSYRDSTLLEYSNEAYIEKNLFRDDDSDDDILKAHGSSCLVGYLSGFAVRVCTESGEYTKAFERLYAIAQRLEVYPVLNEHDLASREIDALYENIQYRSNLVDTASHVWQADWVDQVVQWLSANKPSELEDRDGNGAYPSDRAIAEALWELDLIDFDEACSCGFAKELTNTYEWVD